MNKMIVHQFRALFFLLLFMVLNTLLYTLSAQVIEHDDGVLIAPAPVAGHICTFEPTHEDVHYFIKAEQMTAKSREIAKASDFQATFVSSCGGQTWPAQAQNAFNYAMQLWESHLTSEIPIRIEAGWRSLGGNVLANAGPTLVVNNFAGAEPDTWYAIAQANAMANTDFLSSSNQEFDIVINMNCQFNNWYFGTDGNTPAGQIDFVTVVLHEIGHGIGFTGSMNGNEITETAEWGGGVLQGLPLIYDLFTEDGNSVPLLNENTYPNPSSLLYNAVTGRRGGVFFTGMDVERVLEGMPAHLYAPNPWQGGSSYSHLDQETFRDTENALMRPRMDNALAIHSPGPVFCGMLSEMGWSLGVNCLALLGMESIIAIDQNELNFGISNEGRSVERSFLITNEASAEDPLIGRVEVDSPVFSLAGSTESFNLEPGESVEVTIRYTPQIASMHTGRVDIFHNASNRSSPLTLSLEGEALEADQIVSLEQNFPNPFNRATTIPYALSQENSTVKLDVYSIVGQHIYTLVNDQQAEGRYEVEFDAGSLSSGIYLYRILVDGSMKTRQLLLVK